MVDKLKEDVIEFLVGIHGEEEITLNAKGGVRGEELPTPQVPSIESLLGDIYELRY